MYRIAGKASREPGFSLNEYLQKSEAVEAVPTEAFFVKTGDYTKGGVTQSTVNQLIDTFNGKCSRAEHRSGVTANPECVGNMAVQAYRDTINWEKLAAARVDPPVVRSGDADNDGKQIAREVMAAVIFCGVVIFVMNRLMAVVPHIIVDLIGDYGQTPNLLNQATGQWNQMAKSISDSTEGQVKKSVSGAISGAIGSLTTQRRGPQ